MNNTPPKMEFEFDRKELAEKILCLDGKNFSLTDYPMYSAVYRGTWKYTMLKCGRQVGKSVSAANFEIIDSIAIPYFKTLYVSPSLKQTSAFSNTRVAKIMRHSPMVRDNFLGASLTDNVFLKILSNGSELIFTYAFDNPDRARGYTADRVHYDEVQDILYDEVVPVINECMANSPYGFIGYSGTPKTMENTIEYLWSQSTQTEWCIKCSACGTHSYYTSYEGIGKHGIECLKCAKTLNPREGQWVDMNPVPKGVEKDDPAYYRIKGFHIPQVILPANSEEPFRWARILDKMENYPESRFKNEVMGVSDAIGARLISLDELNGFCGDYDFEWSAANVPANNYAVAGIDWSGGGSKGKSRTVAWVYEVSGRNLKTVWYRIFDIQNPVDTVSEIARVLNKIGVKIVFGDSGEGALANSILKKALGEKRMFQVQYGGAGTGGKPIYWNGRDRYITDRTAAIDTFLYDVKKGHVSYPVQKRSKPAFSDMLNVFEEVTQTGRKVWKHPPGLPDDALHAQVFAWLAARVLQQDLDFYSNA